MRSLSKTIQQRPKIGDPLCCRDRFRRCRDIVGKGNGLERGCGLLDRPDVNIYLCDENRLDGAEREMVARKVENLYRKTFKVLPVPTLGRGPEVICARRARIRSISGSLSYVVNMGS